MNPSKSSYPKVGKHAFSTAKITCEHVYLTFSHSGLSELKES